MPVSDAVNSREPTLQPGWGPDEGRLLNRAALVSLALLVGGPVCAGEMQSPVITLSDVNWYAGAATLTGTPGRSNGG